jgi:predicted DNA-binding transcriptional regulator YafY
MPDETRQRLRDLIGLLGSHPEGLSAVEIADALTVSKRTVYKDRDRLEADGIPIYQEGDLFFLDATYRADIQLSLAQAWFMYLPLRRIVRAELHRYPLVKNLLHRVASLFQEEIADQLVPYPVDTEEQEQDQIFVELVRCWREQCHVELRYQRPNTDHSTKLIIAPWWFEPAVWSDAFYLIGGVLRRDETHEPITLKLDRIRSVRQLDTQFQRPSGQEITTYLEKAWGIWVGEGVQVKLRFHNRQFDRLRETRWHPTQRMMLDESGYVLWEAYVSEPQEMLPWIRGWGSDVEVIEPLNVRQQIAAEAEATARLYHPEGFNREESLF